MTDFVQIFLNFFMQSKSYNNEENGGRFPI